MGLGSYWSAGRAGNRIKALFALAAPTPSAILTFVLCGYLGPASVFPGRYASAARLALFSALTAAFLPFLRLVAWRTRQLEIYFPRCRSTEITYHC